MAQILELIARMQQKAKPLAKYIVIHIDDMVEVGREFRKQGFQLKRGRVPDGSRGNYFQVLDEGELIGIVMVNIHRNTPRGEAYTLREHHHEWTIKRGEFEFDWDDWSDWRLGGNAFNRLYYGRWMYPNIYE